MKIISCFGERTRSGAFFIIVSDEDHRYSKMSHFLLAFSYRCVLPAGLKLNYGLKPQISGIKIVTDYVYRRSIFQVEWVIAALISYRHCPQVNAVTT